MERNFMDWPTSLPAGTVCLREKVDEDKLQTYVENVQEYEDQQKLKEFLRNLANATYENFREMADIPNNPIKSDEYMNAIVQIKKNMSYNCYSSATTPNPGIVTSITERGICATYNSNVAIYNNPEYWAQNNWTVIEKTKNFTLQGHPVSGPIFGNLVSIKEDGMVFYYHSPHDVLDVSHNGFPVADNVMTIVRVGALATYTTPEAREMSIHQRKCRYPDENNLRISPVYTFNFCQMECRMKIARQKCDCIPHVYRKTGKTKICDVQGMRCLGNYSELLIKLVDPATGKKYPCKCLPECDQVAYYLQKADEGRYNVMKNGMSVQYGIELFPRMRLKRDVIFGFVDLWVSIGGSGGLFLGCSVLSLIEIFYFFTIRLFIYILGISRKRRDQRLRQSQKHPHKRMLFM